MAEPISDPTEMLAQMAPRLDPVIYCFMFISPDNAPQALSAAIGTFREDEGVSAIVPEAVARELGEDGPAMARITLTVHSSLEGAGLTAAVSDALAMAGIACNVVAALKHDHLFVPQRRADEAIAVLKRLQAGHSGT